MVDETSVLLQKLGESAKARLVPGTFVGLDGLRVMVDFDNGRVPAHSATGYRPEAGEPVWVMILDGVAYMLGPTVPKPGDGEVVAVSGDDVVLNTDIGSVRATYEAGASFTPGQLVKLIWGNGAHVVGVKSSTPPTVEVPPPSGGSGTGSRVEVFTPIDAGSFGSWWWTGEVWSSPSNVGAWFFGRKIADTIPAGAVIVSVEFFASFRHRQAFAPASIVLHSHQSKPGGAPTFGAGFGVTPTPGWNALPPGWGDALKAGGGAFGIGVNHGGYYIFNSLTADPQSGALRIRYRV